LIKIKHRRKYENGCYFFNRYFPAEKSIRLPRDQSPEIVKFLFWEKYLWENERRYKIALSFIGFCFTALAFYGPGRQGCALCAFANYFSAGAKVYSPPARLIVGDLYPFKTLIFCLMSRAI